MATYPLTHPYRASCTLLWPLAVVCEGGTLTIATEIKDFLCPGIKAQSHYPGSRGNSPQYRLGVGPQKFAVKNRGSLWE